ncbi:unnamed protein product, partial [Iphiclides podalirius]
MQQSDKQSPILRTTHYETRRGFREIEWAGGLRKRYDGTTAGLRRRSIQLATGKRRDPLRRTERQRDPHRGNAVTHTDPAGPHQIKLALMH